MKMPKTLASMLSCAFSVMVLAQCASSGPQRYRSFFQAVELAKSGAKDQAREAFDAACSQSSSAACHRLGQNVDLGHSLAILQGATDETTTEVILLLADKQEAQVFLWDMGRDALIEPKSVQPIELPAGLGRLLQVRYDGLSLGTRYQLQAVGQAGELLDGRELQTLEVTKKKGTLAVASCMDNRNPLQLTIWSELLSHEPEVLLLIGDNVYADSEGVSGEPATVDMLWKRYAETRRDLTLFRQSRLIPILAVWDDHDYGQNDGDRTYRFKADAKKIFQSFFGSADSPGVIDRGPGVASRLSAFGQRFFLLDARTFRSPAKDKSGQTHFGADQEAWLFTDLFGETPTWLISGDQFFGAYHKFESYEGRHPESFRRFLKRLKGQVSPVLFLSGDRHLAEMMEIPTDVLGYRTYELTTSSIHSALYPSTWANTPNPRQIEGVAGVNNYAILRTDAASGLVADIRVYGPGKSRLFSRSVEVRKN